MIGKLVRQSILWAVLTCTCNMQAFAQHDRDIPIINPSLEGTPNIGVPPLPWFKIGKTPDIQPGIFEIKLPASDGKTYIGALTSRAWEEAFGQQLQTPMKAGKTYKVSLDLAYAPTYFFTPICYGSMIIYGSNSPTERGDILWKSGEYMHQNWQRYTATLRPQKDYAYLVFGPYYEKKCTDKVYTGALIDNISQQLAIVPEVTVTSTNACKGVANGTAKVNVQAGQPPYTYRWMPGNYTNAEEKHLRAGQYEVTVTSANGNSAVATVTIGEQEVKASVVTEASRCYGDEQNSILLSAAGGTPPYRYALGVAHPHFYDSPVFRRLPSGEYQAVVVDVVGCADTLRKIVLADPPPLEWVQANIKPTSCGESKDGRISLQVKGGVAPYEYMVTGNGAQWQSDPVLRQLGPGSYTYQVRDANGCLKQGNATITTPWKNCLVVIPTAFSPNGDGQNDLFRPKVYDDIRNYRMTVYNRWGVLVFQSNDPENGWDGTMKGSRLPAQTFVYVCTFDNRNNERQEMRGSLLLVH
ncbi:gliding motility-associated C-terminal domain-containing protein [Chitinophaga pendula]|uniref:T9SS type B sorting domain-containing protein n=1 Tax=Chitinophaga TaxID=79328 RepID=UPI0018DF9B0C|nr:MULTISPECIES: gliding motility-associated C-terminal domain-containing protein [Chitinophaga]UCJ10002.1 gliding motility-associated C-terminal domain-containing protein [Chitinophaga pendula]